MYWFGDISAWLPLERETWCRSSAQSSAQADCKTVQRDAGCADSTRERHFPRSSGSAESGNSRLHLQAQTQAKMQQNRSSWAHILENISKHIEQHVSKLNLRNQSPRVFNPNSISNHFSITWRTCKHAWIQINSKLQFDALRSQFFSKHGEIMDLT